MTFLPLRPTTSPTNKNAHLAYRKSMTSRSVSTRSRRASRGVANCRELPVRRRRGSDGDDGLALAQRSDGEVVIPGPVTDAMAGPVEGQERHEKNIRLDFGGVGFRLANAPLAAIERLI